MDYAIMVGVGAAIAWYFTDIDTTYLWATFGVVATAELAVDKNLL